MAVTAEQTDRLDRIRELADLLGSSRNTIRARRDAEIRAAYAEGLKVPALAEAAGLSSQRIWQLLGEKDS